MTGGRAVAGAAAMCVWGVFLLLFGLLAHRTNVFGVVAGVIFIAAGARWLTRAVPRRAAERDADSHETPETR